MSSLLRLKRQKKRFLKIHCEFAYFSFLLTYLELKWEIRLYTPVVPRKLFPIADQNGQSLYPFSDQNGAKTLPFGAAHTYMAYTGEYPPRGGYLSHTTSRAEGVFGYSTERSWVVCRDWWARRSRSDYVAKFQKSYILLSTVKMTSTLFRSWSKRGPLLKKIFCALRHSLVVTKVPQGSS